MMPSTKHFNLVQDPKLGCTCGEVGCDKRAVKQDTLNQLQCIRDDLGKPIIILSGARCPLHPSERGRQMSDHQDGSTVDVRIDSDLHETKLKVLSGRHGATRVASGTVNGVRILHISWRKTKRKDVPTWSYQ